MTVAAVVLGGSAALVARAHHHHRDQDPATAPATPPATPSTPAHPPSATPTSTPDGAAGPCLTTGLSVHLGTAQVPRKHLPADRVHQHQRAPVHHVRLPRRRVHRHPHRSARSGAPASRNPQQLSEAITVDPGASASAVLQIVNPFNYPTATCHPQPVTAVRVYSPGNAAASELPLPGAATACSTAVTQLDDPGHRPGSTGQ